MSKRLICSESWLRNKIHVKVYLPVPGSIDKLEAPAMGNSPMERDENIMKFADWRKLLSIKYLKYQFKTLNFL